MKPINMRERKHWLIEKPSQQIYFSRMQPAHPSPVFAGVEATVEYGAEVIAMSGIGDNESFSKGLEQRYKVVAKLEFDDHHSYRMNDLKQITKLLAEHPGAVIMTTEKDAVKMSRSKAVDADLRKKMFYEKISMRFVGDDRSKLFEGIDNDIKNRTNGTHIRGL
jgi:tetraacyldisaccharide 4'-kinase